MFNFRGYFIYRNHCLLSFFFFFFFKRLYFVIFFVTDIDWNIEQIESLHYRVLFSFFFFFYNIIIIIIVISFLIIVSNKMAVLAPGQRKKESRN